MPDGISFLGHDVNYWLTLDARAKALDVVSLLEEIADLRARMSFYESRFDQLAQFRKQADERKLHA